MEMTEEVASKIETFFSNYPKRNYAKGHVLILSGDGAEHVYLLISGRVKEYDVTNRGDEIIMNIFKPPAFFPMSLAINKGANPFIYEADTKIEVRVAPADKVVAFVKENPDVMFDLLRRVYRGVDGLLERMVQLMSGSARARLIFELIIECRRFGKGKIKDCTVSATEVDLAARAGLSRETVSREMHVLINDGFVTEKGHTFIVKDVKVLEQKLNSEL